jgi:hypothetical protein
MAALLIARFDGDVDELTQACDRGHAPVMSRGGATSFGELRSTSEAAGRVMNRKGAGFGWIPGAKERPYHDSRPARGRAAALNRLSDHQSLVGRSFRNVNQPTVAGRQIHLSRWSPLRS